MFISFPCLEWLNCLAGRAFLSVVIWRVFAAMTHLCMRKHSQHFVHLDKTPPASAIYDFLTANSPQGPLCLQDKEFPSISQDLLSGKHAHELPWSTDLFPASTYASAGHRTSFGCSQYTPTAEFVSSSEKGSICWIPKDKTWMLHLTYSSFIALLECSLEMYSCTILGRLCMRNFQVSCPLSFITEYLSMFILIFLFSYRCSETVYTKIGLKGLEQFRNRQV